MKVAHTIYKKNMSRTFQLSTMILSKIGNDKHGEDLDGMFFFDENIFSLKQNDPVGERLANIAEKKYIVNSM